MTGKRATLFAVVAVLALVARNSVAIADAAGDCNDGPPEATVKGCTVLIRSGKLERDYLATAYMNRAIAQAQLGHGDLAISDLDEAVKLMPDDVLLHYNRGNILFDAGRLEDAVKDFAAAIAGDPNFALAYLNRGLALHRLGRVEAGRRDLEKAIELDPSLSAARDQFVRLERVE